MGNTKTSREVEIERLAKKFSDECFDKTRYDLIDAGIKMTPNGATQLRCILFAAFASGMETADENRKGVE